MASLIAVDWGSTNCRAALIDPAGTVVDRADGGAGIFDRPNEDFAAQLRRMVAPWRAGDVALPVLLSGMIGSRNGLVEVPYVACPANSAAIAGQLYPVAPEVLGHCWIVPGLHGLTPGGWSDVMRGEEAQILGLLSRQGWESGECLVILPGTHSKWTLVRAGAIIGFATAVSGELYSLLSRHGSLAALLEPASASSFDIEAFREELLHARRSGGLSHHLFNLRARAVLGEIATESLSGRLSALLIGHEVEEMLAMFPAVERIAVVGSEQLGQRYREGIAARGLEAFWMDGDQAAALGAMALAQRAGILELR